MSDVALWAEVAVDMANEKNLTLVVLGGALDQSGDAADLAALLHVAGERFLHTDILHFPPKAAYIIAVDYPHFADYQFARGSVVVDPFDSIRDQVGVSVYRLRMPENPSIEPVSVDSDDENQLTLGF